MLAFEHVVCIGSPGNIIMTTKSYDNVSTDFLFYYTT